MFELGKRFKEKCNGKQIFFLILISPLIILYVIFGLICYFAFGFILTLAVWLFWCPRGRYALFIYSDSPIWKCHIEENILPKLSDHAKVLNWSHRKTHSQYSFPVLIFNYFAGDREWNPMAVIFKPFKVPRTFRFWSGYKSLKRGNSVALNKEIREMFDYLNPE